MYRVENVGEKNPVHLSRCKLRRNTGHFFSTSATDLLVMHLVGEDRWRESAFRFLVTCNVIAHPFGSYNSPRAHMRKPLSARHKYCNTASEWALTHARQLFCPLVWFKKISQTVTLKIKPLRRCSSLSDWMKGLEVKMLITDMANAPRITKRFLSVGYAGNRWTDMREL